MPHELAQPEPAAMAAPVWVLLVISTKLERLLNLVRQRRIDACLFYRVTGNQPPRQRLPYGHPFNPRGAQLARQARQFQEPTNVSSGGRRIEAAITSAASPPPFINNNRPSDTLPGRTREDLHMYSGADVDNYRQIDSRSNVRSPLFVSHYCILIIPYQIISFGYTEWLSTGRHEQGIPPGAAAADAAGFNNGGLLQRRRGYPDH